MPQFLANVAELERNEREQLVDAALNIIEQTYVHLPLKRAMHAVEPIQRLKLLRQRLDTKSVRGFHDEMIAIFHGLRDLHTNYVLPVSYHGKTAFLPFLVEDCFDGNPPGRRYVVTGLRPDLVPADFTRGVLLTYWNGMPIDRAVELNAEREAGSNEDARHARGLEALTIRPMHLTAPPDEEWVTVGYEADGQHREHRFHWRVFEPPPSPTGMGLTEGDVGMARVLGVDPLTEAVRRSKKALFDPPAMRNEQRMAVAAANAGLSFSTGMASPGTASQAFGVDELTETARRTKKALFFPDAMNMERQMDAAVKAATGGSPPAEVGQALQQNTTLMPDVFAFKRVQAAQGDLGYIRIYTFMVADADAFVAEFIRIARLLPQNGLIIDVRGNGGGNILAGERLLQVLTPQPIEPERLHFVNTATTLELCRRAPGNFDLIKWAPSIEMAIETGEPYSQGLPLDPVDDYNRIGQQYQGPVVLIINALCYSTTDIFAAGFQDHGIGKVLGTARHTGAGGANVWDYGLLRALMPDRFEPLPKGASFRVAIRRTTRVKEYAGVPLEDLGVEPDDVHLMTRNDVLNGNTDLIAKAAQLLAGEKIHSLSGRIDRSQPQVVVVRAEARNLSRVDVYMDGRPLGSGDVRNGAASVTLPPETPDAGTLELRGFEGREVKTIARIML
ncbi:MAG TPA: S41 family peptidase [Arenibaculum sp.]|nr:S41 family peptidase [Arenibaculum sp.]